MTAPATPRVYLRPPTLRDCGDFLALNRASRRLYSGLASPMTSRRAFAEYVARCRRPDYEGLLVCRHDDDAIAGCVNVSQIVRGCFQSGYLGYRVFVPYQSQGYMTSAMPLVLRHVFRSLRLHRVEANIQPGNARSVALVKHAGFRLEGHSPRYLKIAGRWRDHERWAITVDDWRDGKQKRA